MKVRLLDGVFHSISLLDIKVGTSVRFVIQVLIERLLRPERPVAVDALKADVTVGSCMLVRFEVCDTMEGRFVLRAVAMPSLYLMR